MNISHCSRNYCSLISISSWVGSSINEKADYISVYHFQPSPYPRKETLCMYAFIWMPFCSENNVVWDEKIRDACFFCGFSLLLQAKIALLYPLLKGIRCLESAQRYRNIEIKRMGYKADWLTCNTLKTSPIVIWISGVYKYRGIQQICSLLMYCNVCFGCQEYGWKSNCIISCILNPQ